MAVALTILGTVLGPGGTGDVACATAAAPAQVERVRYESDGSSTRVIVMLSRAVPHEVRTLPGDPARGSEQRLVIDFSNARLGRAARVPIGAEHGILQRIRTGQFTERTARVVLDLAGESRYQVRAFTAPARLVIDVVARPGVVLAAPSPPAEVVAAPERPRVTTPPADTVRPPAQQIPPAPHEARAPDPATRPVESRAPSEATVGAAAREVPPAPVEETRSPTIAEESLAPEPAAAPAPVLAVAPTIVATPQAERVAAARKPRRTVPPPANTGGEPWRIVLDPGHGGTDPGARGVDGLLEKDVVLLIARRLKARLESELNAIVMLTRDGDETRSLADRTAFANASGAHLFVSIHANADDAGRLHGIETYTLNNSHDRATIRLANMENGPQLDLGDGDLSFILSDMVQSSKEEESIALAERLHGRLLGRLRARYPDVRNLGVKKGPFYVLVGAYMPCVLIETSFLTHPVEGKRLAAREYQQDIAEGLFLGIRDYLADARLAKTL